MFAGKPVIGIVGGIGSGKSFVARQFGERGCLVIDSDEQIRQAYLDPEIQQTLRQWWGDAVFTPQGEIDKSAIAAKVFQHPPQRQRLEHLLHPFIARQRDRLMRSAAEDPQVLAYVWDTPLLFEVGLDRQCDAVVFVEAPLSQRQQRVQQTRGWSDKELENREKFQLPLDKKRQMAHYIVVNTADADAVRNQVGDVLSRIFASRSIGKGSETRGLVD